MGQAVGYWTGQSGGRSWWRGGAGQGVAARGGVRLRGPSGGRGVGRGRGGWSTEGNSHRDPGVGLHLASTPGFCDILEAGRQVVVKLLSRSLACRGLMRMCDQQLFRCNLIPFSL